MTKLLNTTRIQLASLDRFAAELGYDYNGKCFENEVGNKVSFERMVMVHNGKVCNLREFMYYKKGDPVKMGNEYVPLEVIEEARTNRIVEQVKLQQKKNGTIVTQSHIIETVV